MNLNRRYVQNLRRVVTLSTPINVCRQYGQRAHTPRVSRTTTSLLALTIGVTTTTAYIFGRSGKEITQSTSRNRRNGLESKPVYAGKVDMERVTSIIM